MTERKRIAAVNVDVDGLHLYYQIHGLSKPATSPLPSVWETGVVRFLDLFQKLGLRATFFVVTEDLANPKNRTIAQQALAEGHELASHSHTHPYDLVLKSEKDIVAELTQSQKALADLGVNPTEIGFRAPGYNTSPQLLDLLARQGFAYDSSVFPCPPYMLAKAAFLLAYRVTGHESKSILTDWRQSFASRMPHLTTTQSGLPLWEFPITVLPGIRFPIIGTSLITLGQTGFQLIRPALKSVPFVNLEFHAIDMTDHQADRIDPALRRQPDQRVPLAQKEQVFRDCLTFLRDRWDNATLGACVKDPTSFT